MLQATVQSIVVFKYCMRLIFTRKYTLFIEFLANLNYLVSQVYAKNNLSMPVKVEFIYFPTEKINRFIFDELFKYFKYKNIFKDP